MAENGGRCRLVSIFQVIWKVIVLHSKASMGLESAQGRRFSPERRLIIERTHHACDKHPFQRSFGNSYT